MDEIKRQKIIEAEKSITAFFKSLNPDKFSDEARKEFAKKYRAQTSVSLSARAYDRTKIGNRGGRLQNN